MTLNDTTTQLNPATGGDKMAETEVLQSDLSVAKMPRVVLFDDNGDVIPVRAILDQMLSEQRRTNELLQMIAEQL
jgi:hypothetical protein